MNHGPRKPDPEVVAATVELIRGGASLRVAGAFAGVSAVTASRWRDEEKKKGAVFSGYAPPDAAVQERLDRLVAGRDAPPAAPVEADERSPIDLCRAMVSEVLDAVRTAKREGDRTTAQRAMRDLTMGLMPLLARLDKAETEANDTLKISRAEIAETMVGLRARAAAICERPLMCSACSRALSVDFGGRSADGAPGADPEQTGA